MPKAWSGKRERQYEHVKESEKKQGRSTKRAKEIAARTVNKQRAQKGETKGSSSKSRSSSSSSRSSSSGNGGQTKEQLYNQAKRLNIPGRSKMSKQQLQRAVARRK
jgi:hypothetical protein